MYIKLVEFDIIRSQLKFDDTILIRFFNHNINEYIDVMGKVGKTKFVAPYKSIKLVDIKIIKTHQCPTETYALELDYIVNKEGEKYLHIHYTNMLHIVTNYDRIIKIKKIQDKIRRPEIL